MDKGIQQSLQKFAAFPIPHELIISLLKDYKRPNDKIHELIKEGSLIPVKKGLYIVSPELYGNKPEAFLLANYIYGPSYVSAETALSFYGLIPERVYEVTSMSIKHSRSFTTPIGVFSYTKLPLPYYAFGIQQVRFTKQQVALIATPEKALCDKIVTTSGILFRSHTQAFQYLTEDLRIDPVQLNTLNTNLIASWIEDAPKSTSLKILLTVLNQL